MPPRTGVLEVSGDIHGQRQAPDRAVGEIAARQYGVIARHQLGELGLSEHAVESRLRSGRLLLLHRGFYAVGHSCLSARAHWMAAVLACGEGAVLSHRSAAALWGLRATDGKLVDVTAPTLGRRSHLGLAVHTARSLRPQDRATVDGIPVTSLARTLLDVASLLNARQLERAFEAGERLRILDMRELHELAARSHGHHGLKAFRGLIDDHDPVPETRSDLERDFVDFCADHGLPRPVFNVAVEGFMVDALWPSQCLVAELDSWGFHATRTAFESDRARDAALQLAGYNVVRITSWRMSRDAEGAAATIRGFLDRAAAA